MSLCSRVGEGSVKQVPRHSLNGKSGNSNGKGVGQPLKARDGFVVHDPSSEASPSSVSNEAEAGVHYLDKCMVTQDNECSIASDSGALNVTDSDCKTGDNQEFPQNGNPKVLPKIKWGDLDDGALIRFGGIANDNLVCRKAENADGSVSCMSSCTDPEENKLVVTSTDANDNIQDSLLSSPKNEFFEVNYKEVNQAPLEDMKPQILEGKMVSPSGDISCCGEARLEHSKITNTYPVDSSSLSDEHVLCAVTEEAGSMLELSTPVVLCEAGDSEISQLPVVEEALTTVAVSQDSETVQHEKNRLEIPTEPTMIASTKDGGGQLADSIIDTLSKNQIISASDADDPGESKERFRQRLWCFLFENLNRAVDELYLLCELECDLDQMNEASLVLEEAASDFKELSSRVEEFERVKKSSSQLADGTPITMKSDHRRPHALSWEVSMLAFFSLLK